MRPDLFLTDLEAKPKLLYALADALDAADPWRGVPAAPDRVLLLGMGSSRYAAQVAALRLRAAGIDAVAEYASAGSAGGERVAALAGGEGVAALARRGRRDGRLVPRRRLPHRHPRLPGRAAARLATTRRRWTG